MSVLLLSGGVDSLVLLAREVRAGRAPRLCVSFDYGQRHRRELEAAWQIAGVYRVPHTTLRLPPEPFTASALTGGGDVPKGLHFADPAQAATVVPNRNMTMLALAGGLAVKCGAKAVLFGAHAGDAAVYADCRAGFVAAVSEAMVLACGVRVEAPFLTMDKAAVVALGAGLGVPFALAWSCYVGGDEPCGECGACAERQGAGA